MFDRGDAMTDERASRTSSLHSFRIDAVHKYNSVEGPGSPGSLRL